MFEDYGLLQKKSSSAEINMAPLLDMVFILLIFFIITTNFNRQTGLEVKKPKAQSAVYQGQKTIMVGISKEGTIHIHNRQVDLQRLSQILSYEASKRPDANVVIIADQGSQVGRSVEVMDAALVAGIKQVSMAADKK